MSSWPDLHQHWTSKPPWRSDLWRATIARSGFDDDKPPWTNKAKRSKDPAPPPPFEAELQATVAGNPTTVTQTTPQLSQTQPDRELSMNATITIVDKGREWPPNHAFVASREHASSASDEPNTIARENEYEDENASTTCRVFTPGWRWTVRSHEFGNLNRAYGLGSINNWGLNSILPWSYSTRGQRLY